MCANVSMMTISEDGAWRCGGQYLRFGQEDGPARMNTTFKLSMYYNIYNIVASLYCLGCQLREPSDSDNDSLAGHMRHMSANERRSAVFRAREKLVSKCSLMWFPSICPQYISCRTQSFHLCGFALSVRRTCDGALSHYIYNTEKEYTT